VIAINAYQPGKVNTQISFPTTWNELLLTELHAIAQNILTNFTQPEEAKAAMLLSLLKIRSGKKIKNIVHRLDAEETLLQVMPALDFIYKENDLTKQPYPILKFRWRKFYGLADDFNTLTCGEFEDAEQYFNQFKADPDAENLACLAAVLYRPKHTPYMRYNHRTGTYKVWDSDSTVKYFARQKPWLLYTIYLWYSGCRNQLPKYFPKIHQGDGDAADVNDMMIFTRCIHAGAGPKNGSRNQIRCTPLKEFLMECEEEKTKALEQQKQTENANR
jgi:hypothetical protein